MPGQGQRQFLPVDAAAVVAHANQLRTARGDVDLDVVGARIEAVLDEFLDDRGWPLDDLARSDLVDQVTWELLDGHEG